MKRFRRLSGYQKGLLLLMAATVIVFAVLYPVTMSRSGYLWRNTILEYSGTEPGARVYSGRYRGQTACFTVRDGAVEFQYGGQSYGPYTVRVDPAADNGDIMKGIAIYCGDICVYRCTVSYIDKLPLLPTDGNSPVVPAGSQLSPYPGGSGDPVQPTATEILELMREPGLERKGQPGAFFFGVLVCVIGAVAMLYAEEIFRRSLRFTIREPEKAEPSDWELANRSIAPTAVYIFALVIFILGLK